jgi:hypothetical protein
MKRNLKNKQISKYYGLIAAIYESMANIDKNMIKNTTKGETQKKFASIVHRYI